MKKYLLFLMIAALALFSACSDDNDKTIYTVTFETDGGNPVPATQSVEEGAVAVAPTTDPAKEGYVFDFWRLRAEAEAYDFNTPVNSNLVLYAKWLYESDFWKVAWELNGGKWSADDDDHITMVIKDGMIAEPKAPAREEYTFEGWYKEADLINKVSFPYDVSNIKSNLTFYAKWLAVEDKVWIPAGTFIMGSSPEEPFHNYDEIQHQVTLTQGFYMSRYQVTIEQYAAFLNDVQVEGVAGADQPVSHTVAGYGREYFFATDGDGLTPLWNATSGKWEASGPTPMINVSWYGAKAYADWVGGELPTEAQWEYACRAGTTTAYSFGDNQSLLGNYAIYQVNSTTYTYGPNPVGTKLPNAWGLYDMHGNVWEWCSDWYHENYGSDNPGDDAIDPIGPDKPIEPASDHPRLLRGGAWYCVPAFCRSAWRNYSDARSLDAGFGFRVVFK